MTASAECLIAQCLLSTTEEICCHLGCVKSWSMSLVLHKHCSAGPPSCRITHLSACNLGAGAWKKVRRYLKKWLKSCHNRDVTSIRFSDVQVLLYRHATDARKVWINWMESFAIHSFSSLSYDRSKASSKASSPHSAIQCFLLQMRVTSPFLKVSQYLPTSSSLSYCHFYPPLYLSFNKPL
jgi:hypothetical protein